jgi:hypothetical protein
MLHSRPSSLENGRNTGEINALDSANDNAAPQETP